uniref:Uncharacterized protein n=2 Tax=unclassified Caudoviricetes TaxID=2788787 RepID=A0A8S5PHK7_9CAUD|nr:MAG TPA: hypothetical protein [Siphoviridae sp. ctJcm18]DAE06679.1 MAG TPA: hypothetical protein [Siphoviridae sp. ctUGQ45]
MNNVNEYVLRIEAVIASILFLSGWGFFNFFIFFIF